MQNSIMTLALAAAVAFSAGAQAQTASLTYSAHTGDVWLDIRLSEINTFGQGDPVYFYDDMSSNYGVPRDYVRELVDERHWAPGDIYYACALAQTLDRPCSEIVSDYDRHPGQGWGALAKRMGIKPGSAQFHELKGRVGKGHGKLKAHGGPKHQGTPQQGKDKSKDKGKNSKDKGKSKGDH